MDRWQLLHLYCVVRQSLVLWSRCTGTWDVGELGDDSGRRCSSNWPPVTEDVSPAESQSSVGAEEEA